MADGDLPLATGGSVRAAGTWPDAWTGPVGWLPHVESDELLGLQWTGAVLEVAPASVDRDVAMERAARVCQVLARHRPRPRSSWSPRPGGQETLAEVVLAALVEVPDLLAVPLHPLDEVVPMAPEDEPNWCVAASSYAAEPVETASLALHLPLPLRDELDRRAEFLGVPVHAYAEQVLAAAAWRTESRFRRSSPWAHEADPWRDGRPDDTGDHWPDPARDPWS